MLVSVIIPCRNEEAFIGKVIENVFDQDVGAQNIELLIAEGRSDDQTREIIESYISDGYNVVLIDNPDKVVSPGLNKCLEQVKGDWIVRMDAHAIYPSNYISKLIAVGQRSNVGNVGGVLITLAGNSSVKAEAIASAISHPLGVGNSSFRTGVNEIKKVDTVPFGCFPKKVLDQVGYYDNDLLRNQDDELNLRIIQAGYDILLDPSVTIEYFARTNFKSTGKMFFQYGLFKPLVNKKRRQPATWRQFVPPVFFAGVVVGLVISLLVPNFNLLYGAGLILYFLLLALFASKESVTRSNKLRFVVNWVWAVFLIHMSYGYGYWRGILQFVILNKSYSNTGINR